MYPLGLMVSERVVWVFHGYRRGSGYCLLLLKRCLTAITRTCRQLGRARIVERDSANARNALHEWAGDPTPEGLLIEQEPEVCMTPSRRWSDFVVIIRA